MPTELYEAYQRMLMGVCVCGLAVVAAGPLVMKLVGHALDKVRSFYRNSQPFERLVVIVFFCGMAFYGATKNVAWNLVANYGGDTALQVTGIYTGMSNDVVQVGGIPVTNQVPLVKVAALGNITAATPVWFRMSDTNDWSLAVKTYPKTYTEGPTNNVEFVTSDNFAGYTYWWAGNDTPAVIRPTEGIKVTGYTACGTNVVFTFTCDDPNCTTFEAKWKLTTEPDSAFRTAATSSGSTLVVPGFWVGRSIDWRITSSYLEDGE